LLYVIITEQSRLSFTTKINLKEWLPSANACRTADKQMAHGEYSFIRSTIR